MWNSKFVGHSCVASSARVFVWNECKPAKGKSRFALGLLYRSTKAGLQRRDKAVWAECEDNASNFLQFLQTAKSIKLESKHDRAGDTAQAGTEQRAGAGRGKQGRCCWFATRKRLFLWKHNCTWRSVYHLFMISRFLNARNASLKFIHVWVFAHIWTYTCWGCTSVCTPPFRAKESCACVMAEEANYQFIVKNIMDI